MSFNIHKHNASPASIWNDWAWKKSEARKARKAPCYSVCPETGERTEIVREEPKIDIQALKDYCYLHKIPLSTLLGALQGGDSSIDAKEGGLVSES